MKQRVQRVCRAGRAGEMQHVLGYTLWCRCFAAFGLPSQGCCWFALGWDGGFVLYEEEGEFPWIIANNVSRGCARSHTGVTAEKQIKLGSPCSQYNSEQQGMWGGKGIEIFKLI